MSDFTPGPWHESRTGNHQGLIVADSGENVAVAYDKKDAPLIASAPDLLAALDAALIALADDDGPHATKARKAGRAAIAKATGGDA